MPGVCFSIVEPPLQECVFPSMNPWRIEGDGVPSSQIDRALRPQESPETHEPAVPRIHGASAQLAG